MHKTGFRTLPSFAIVICAISISGQGTVLQQTTPCPVNPPKSLSYTAEVKVHSAQTLADGTTITRDGKERFARDSQGRTLNVTAMLGWGPALEEGDAMTFANVDDPVAGTEIQWNSQTQKATLRKMPTEQRGCWTNGAGATWNFGPRTPIIPAAASSASPKTTGSSFGIIMGARVSAPSSLPDPMRPNISRQDLGTAIIMGIEAHGTRTAITTPAGAVGNDKPLVRTTEVWNAPGLGVALRRITTDPRMGTETREVISLDLTEPPISTFQPPEGYEIETEELHEVPCQQ